MNRLAIMIIVWNNHQDAVDCADSLLSQTDNDFQLLFIDNASNPHTVEALKDYIAKNNQKDIQLIQTGYNGGTAGGFNTGIRWAIDNDYDFIGTLNADAVAVTNWVKELMSDLQAHPDAGIVTGMTLRKDKQTIDTTGDFYTTWGIPGPRGRDEKIATSYRLAEYIFGASGGAFIGRTVMYNDIGLFDEKFFMYYEDVDISFRAQLMGYKARYVPTAIAYHALGASSKTVPGLAIYNTFKNLPLLLWKNVPTRLLPVILPRFLLMYTLILGHSIVKGKYKYSLKGFIYSLMLLPHAFRQRRFIQKTRRATNDYISSIIIHDVPKEQTGLRKFRDFFLFNK